METYFYLLLIEDDTVPSVEGPFVSSGERDEAAMECRNEGFDGGIFPLNITAEEEPYKVETDTLDNEGFEEVKT